MSGLWMVSMKDCKDMLQDGQQSNAIWIAMHLKSDEGKVEYPCRVGRSWDARKPKHLPASPMKHLTCIILDGSTKLPLISRSVAAVPAILSIRIMQYIQSAQTKKDSPSSCFARRSQHFWSVHRLCYQKYVLLKYLAFLDTAATHHVMPQRQALTKWGE